MYNSEDAQYLAKLATEGQELTNFGKMCRDCAFKPQEDINGYSGAVQAAISCLSQEGVFNCHTRDYQDSGVECKGFLYAKAALLKNATLTIKDILNMETINLLQKSQQP